MRRLPAFALLAVCAVVAATLAPAQAAAGLERAEGAGKQRNLLVVALGDSVASGEGNPQGPGLWLNRPCHRSAAAGFQQAVRLLDEGLTHRSISFVNLACSGADVREGLLGPYAGVSPDTRVGAFPPQVEQLERVVKSRAGGGGRNGAVDAILLSVGANDVHFSDIVKACAAPGDCRKGREEQVFADLARLRRDYDRLGGRLDRAAPGTPVLITEYFDPTHDEEGRFCGRSVGFTSRAEMRWAYEGLLRPLNAEVAAAAVRNGWSLVGGIASDFERHGYCAGRSERWVRRLSGSLFSQHDLLGTIHPSWQGHAAIAQRVAVRLAPVLGLTAPAPPRAEPESGGRSALEWIGIGAGALLAAIGLAALAWILAHAPPGNWPMLFCLWLALLLAALLGLVLLPALLLGLLALRVLRLLRPTWLPDPCRAKAAAPRLKRVPRPAGLRQALLLGGGVALLIALAALFAGAVGSTILWLRFWSARLPADQSLDAVSRSELAATGAGAVALFAVLGLLAMGLAWLLDGKGQWVRSTRRGLVAIGLVEMLVAILIGDFRRDQALQLFAGLAVAALLFHFLLDRVLPLRWVVQSDHPFGSMLDWLEKRWRRRDRSWRRLPLRLWQALPLLLLAFAVIASFRAEGLNRDAGVLLPFALAAILFVLPGGLAAKGVGRSRDPAALKSLEAPRIALALAGVVCVFALIVRDEAWLAATAAVATVLGLFCLAVAAASGQRFAPYGLAVLVSVPLFGGAATMLRGLDSPELQPVAVILGGGKPVCGAYVGESDGGLWIGRLVLDERADVNRPRRGTIFSVDSDRIAERVLGPLQPVARVEMRAVELRNEMLDARGNRRLERRAPTCAPRKPVPKPEPSWQRRLAERYQPELILDRRDRFWPVPVKTLFSMQDRRAAICRQVAPDDDSCLRLTTQGEFPWAGGEGESLEHPAADTDKGAQHDLMVDALGSADPDRTAAEYFLVAGSRGGRRPITVQYWFFYPFNYQPIRGKILQGGFHEGDFESVGVLLSARTMRPRYFWMARHDKEGRILPWGDDALQAIGDHPLVFVARGSHASYESCADQIRYVAPYHLVDDRPTCDPDRQLRLTPEATPITDLSRVAWGCWHGNFGHRSGGRGYEQIPYLVADAPLSPLWQQHFGGVVSEPCRGIADPGGREGPGEEVVEEKQGVPARLRRTAGRLEPLVDQCGDWESPPPVGTYMVACDQEALSAYLASGLEDPGAAGVRIDVASVSDPQVGEATLPAVRRNREGVYLDDWRIAAATPTVVSVYASCPQNKRIVGVRFSDVAVDPAEPLRLLDRGRGGIWRLSREDGTTVAQAEPFALVQRHGELVEAAPRRDRIVACGGD